MGWGDEIIASGQARLLYEQFGHKVAIHDRFGQQRDHEAWIGNPHIATRADRDGRRTILKNGPGHRPYIAEKHTSHWKWKEWECPVGEIYLRPDEKLFANSLPSGIIVIEPNMKQKASPNKYWGKQRWEALIDLMIAHGLKPVQLGAVGTQVLRGAELINTPTMRHACAVLARSRAAVLPEGGLHHAAAAFGIKAVVIYGGYISPKQTGYSIHTNLFTGGTACGRRVDCAHCAAAMAEITPWQVFKELEKILER